MAKLKLSAARRAGLEVLAKWDPQRVAYSNNTHLDGRVYWQTADWLVGQGYAVPAPGQTLAHFSEFGLTDSGRDLCGREGIALPDDEWSPLSTTTAAPSTAAAPTAAAPTFAVIPIDQLVPSPGNLRRDMGDLTGLADSIRADGVLQPLLVTPDFPDPDRWMVLAGHRRLAASGLAGLTEVPCMIQEAVSADSRVSTFLVENLQREGLAALEEAEGYRQLVELGWSQRKIAEHVGCTQSHVSKRLSLLDLPDDIQARVDLPPSDPQRITLEDAGELHKLVEHPAALKAAAKGNIAAQVSQALAKVAFVAAAKRLLADAEARGWPTRKRPTSYGEDVPWALLGYSRAHSSRIEIDADAHESEPCHAVLEPPKWEYWLEPPTELERLCVDPARHTKKGESKLKVPAAPKAAKPGKTGEAEWQRLDRLRREAQASAAEIRLPLLRSMLSGKLDGSVAEIVITTLVRELDSDGYLETDVGAACELLGVSLGDVDVDSRAAIITAAKGDVVRAGYAIALSIGESAARVGHVDPTFYDQLIDRGYVPSEWERVALDALVLPVDPAEDRPEGAVAWYHGWPVDSDPPRWLTDLGEAEVIAAIHPGRVLMLSAAGDAVGIRLCRACGCTEDNACTGGCSWAEVDLCSACVPLAAAAAG